MEEEQVLKKQSDQYAHVPYWLIFFGGMISMLIVMVVAIQLGWISMNISFLEHEQKWIEWFQQEQQQTTTSPETISDITID